MKGKKIGVIGGGKMGGALIGGILAHHLVPAEAVIVADVDKGQREELEKNHAVKTTDDNRLAAKSAQIIILAVKPQNMAEVLAGISGVVDKNKLVISIAAGIPIRFISERLKAGARIIRTMPNTPALVGGGVMGTANSVQSMAEALGLTLPGCASIPGVTMIGVCGCLSRGAMCATCVLFGAIGSLQCRTDS